MQKATSDAIKEHVSIEVDKPHPEKIVESALQKTSKSKQTNRLSKISRRKEKGEHKSSQKLKKENFRIQEWMARAKL